MTWDPQRHPLDARVLTHAPGDRLDYVREPQAFERFSLRLGMVLVCAMLGPVLAITLEIAVHEGLLPAWLIGSRDPR